MSKVIDGNGNAQPVYYCDDHEYAGPEPCALCVKARKPERKPLPEEEQIGTRIERAYDAFERFVSGEAGPHDKWRGESILVECSRWLGDAQAAIQELRGKKWNEGVASAQEAEAGLLVPSEPEKTE